MRTHLIHRPARDIIPHWVDLECSPITFDCARFSCSHDLPGPAELGAINPDAMHDHSQPAWSKATIAFFPIPRRLAICIAQASLSQDHFFDHSML